MRVGFSFAVADSLAVLGYCLLITLLLACQPVSQSVSPRIVSLPTSSPSPVMHGFGSETLSSPRPPQAEDNRPKNVSPLPREITLDLPPVLPVATATPKPIFGNSGDGSSGGGGSSFVAPAPTPTPLFYVANIINSETGESILNSQTWKPDYFGTQPLKLTILGNFKLQSPLQESLMRFTYEPGLLHQTFVSSEPTQRILLDGIRPLEVLQIEPEQIQVELPTHFLTDLQVSGTHTLSIETEEQSISVNMQVKGIESSLAPQIEQVKLHFENAQPATLQLNGNHFMLDPLKNQVIVDGENLNCSATQIYQNGRTETFVDIRSLVAFAPQETHQLQFRTPLGQTLYFFQGL
jgi:hypothetical protein